MRFRIVIVVIFVTNSLVGQNLIKNPSFELGEQYDECQFTLAKHEHAQTFADHVDDWYSTKIYTCWPYWMGYCTPSVDIMDYRVCPSYGLAPFDSYRWI